MLQSMDESNLNLGAVSGIRLQENSRKSDTLSELKRSFISEVFAVVAGVRCCWNTKTHKKNRRQALGMEIKSGSFRQINSTAFNTSVHF